MSTIFKLRRDTSSNWSTNNPVLADGELGFDRTNVYLKIGDGTTAWNSLGQFTQTGESIEDQIGAMVNSNTEAFITVTYDDSDGTLDFTVPVLDEDNLNSNSATHLATQQSIKAYVDAQVTAQDLDFTADTGGVLSIDLDTETLGIGGSTGIDTVGSGNNVQISIDSTVVTKTDTQTLSAKTLTTPVIASLKPNGSTTLTMPVATDTLVGKATTDTLTNKTLTSPVINTGVSGSAVLDSDTMSGASATTLATSESIKAYVDNQVTIQDLDTAGDTGTGAVDLDSQSLTISGTTNQITTVASGQGITIGLPDNVTIAGNLTVAGTQTTLSSTTINVADPMLSLATGNASSDAVDIGFYGLYDTSGSQDLYSGLFRDANDSGKWKLYKDSQSEPTTTVNVSATGYATGTLVANLEGNVTGNVTGNTSGTALTVTQAAQTAITSVGTLTALQVDNVNINGNTIAATSGVLNLTSPVLNTGVSGSAFLDEDDLSSNSATKLASQQSIKAYVDASVTAQDLDFDADSGGELQIDLDSEKITFTGGTGITTVGSGNVVTFNIDSTVATLTDTQTMSAKTLTSPVLNTGISGTAFLDEDNLASDSATKVASQQSIKAYVDAQTTAQDLDFQGDSGGALNIDLNSEVLDIAGGTGVTTTGSGNTLTVAIGQAVATNSNVEFANVIATGNLTVNGTTTTINTTNTTVTDSLVEYSTGTSGTPANDAGLVIERGDQANAFIGFDESADKFTVGTGTFTGASTGNLSITTGTLVANIEGATVTTTGNITVGGTVDGRDIDTDGTKLDTIETNADVTDAANVESAGAVMESGAVASAKIPAGTTAQRDASPSAGFFRWNTTIPQAEIYTGSEWSLVGGGNITKEVNWEHESELDHNYVMEDGNNAISAGPITINTGKSFIVGSGSVWAII